MPTSNCKPVNIVDLISYNIRVILSGTTVRLQHPSTSAVIVPPPIVTSNLNTQTATNSALSTPHTLGLLQPSLQSASMTKTSHTKKRKTK